MSYALPDEPRGALRPELAVSAIWPALALMLVGPLAGFAWLAFNAWALGCRHAVRHTAIAAVMIPTVGLAVYGIALAVQVWIEPVMPEHASLVARLALIAVQTVALALAFWIMWNQNEAEEWRRTFGPPLGNGAKPFAVLFVARIVFGHRLPAEISIFALWTGA